MDEDDPSLHFEKNEFIRLIGAALKWLGFEKSAAALESDSQVQLDPESASQLRYHVLNGNWPQSLQVLEEIATLDSEAKARARHCILKQQSLELMQQHNDSAAIDTLQSMEDLHINHEEVENMCTYLLPIVPFRVPARADVLPQLEKLLPSGHLIVKRLVELVEQALLSQTSSCIYHNSTTQKISLFRDHRCGADQIPNRIHQTVKEHNGNIWRLRFSKKGDYLASCDNTAAVVWQVYQCKLVLKQRFSGPGFITDLCFDPEGLQLVISGEEGVYLRDIMSGECVGKFSKAGGVSITSCAWSKEEHGCDVIITGNDDDSLSEWTLKGYERRTWEGKAILKTDIAIGSNKEIISGSRLHTVSVFNHFTSEEKKVHEKSNLVAFALSSDLKNLVASLDDNTISLWNIEGCPKHTRIFNAADLDVADLVSFNDGVCFGGVGDAFIAGANMDSKVRIWHKSSGSLVCTLEGHAGGVVAVCWNPTNPTMIVTGGEDGTMMVWGTK